MVGLSSGPPTARSTSPKRAWLKLPDAYSICVKSIDIPSVDSQSPTELRGSVMAAEVAVSAIRQSSTLLRFLSSVCPKFSATVPCTLTTAPMLTSGPMKLLSKTKIPSEVSESPSTSESSSWRKKPRNSSPSWKSPTTTPSMITPGVPTMGLEKPGPCTSWMKVAGSPQLPNGGTGKTLMFSLPGVPKSPSPKGVTDSPQFAPTLLSREGSSSDIEAPFGSGKAGPPSHSTRLTSVKPLSSRINSSALLDRKNPPLYE